MITLGSLFSGIGGLELGLENALRDGGFDVSTIWQCESNPWCRSVLARHWPDAVRHDDVQRLRASNAAPVDVLCGGFPCQDVSRAGTKTGLDGERSGLWWQFARIIRELRPRFVVVENVSTLANLGLDDVLGSLSDSGYDAQWTCVRASDVGAPHRRERLFIVAWRVADAVRERSPRELPTGAAPRAARRRGAVPRASEPRLGGGAHGLPAGLDAHRWPVGRGEQQPDGEPPRVTDERGERAQRLKALGNAVVPQVAYVVGCVVADLLRRGVA